MSHEMDQDLFRDNWNREYDEIRKEVEFAYPNSSRHEVSLLTKAIFRSEIYIPDKESIARELSDSTEYEGSVGFKLDDEGNVVYPDFHGRSMLELSERQMEFNPEKFNRDEYAMQVMVNQAFRNGAREVSYPMFVTDADGNKQVRDVYTMRWDGENGTLTVRKIAENDNQLSMHDAHQVMRTMFDASAEQRIAEDMVLFTDRKLADRSVGEAMEQADSAALTASRLVIGREGAVHERTPDQGNASSQDQRNAGGATVEPHDNPQTDAPRSMAGKVAGDVSFAARSLVGHLEKTRRADTGIDTHRQGALDLQKLPAYFQSLFRTSERIELEKRTRPHGENNVGKPVGSVPESVAATKPPETKSPKHDVVVFLNPPPKDGVAVPDTITGSARDGARAGEKRGKTEMSVVSPVVEKKTSGEAKTQISKHPEKRTRHRRERVAGRPNNAEGQTGAERKRKRDHKGERREMMRGVGLPERRLSKERKEKRMAKRTERRQERMNKMLLDALRLLAAPEGTARRTKETRPNDGRRRKELAGTPTVLERRRTRSERRRAVRTERQKERRSRTERVMSGLIVAMLLLDAFRSDAAGKDVGAAPGPGQEGVGEKKEGAKAMNADGKPDRGTDRDPPERSTPWLLFSIIWHLAQLRESGFAAAIPVKKAKNAKKQKKRRSRKNATDRTRTRVRHRMPPEGIATAHIPVFAYMPDGSGEAGPAPSTVLS